MWRQLVLGQLSASQAQDLVVWLEDNGALAITLNPTEPLWTDESLPSDTKDFWAQAGFPQPHAEHPSSGQVKPTQLVALFEGTVNCSQIVQGVQGLCASVGWHWQDLPDQAWQQLWHQDLSPIQIGQRLWICPTHCEVPPEALISVRLDPGLAFGSGTHPTTAMCLSYLENTDLVGKTVCDYGAGSGILAISALKLGAEKAYAIDIDPQALIAAQANAENNGLSTEQMVVMSPEQWQNTKVDVLVANILARPLMALSLRFRDALQSSGQCILSGLLEEQVAQVLEVYEDWAQVLDVAYQDKWARLVLTTKD